MIRLSLLECRDPIGSRHSLCNPLVAPALIAGGAGLLGSLIGGSQASKNTKATNATNLQIARETNQMSLDAMREQNQFNRSMALEMFNRENEYNDPANQARLWLNAGFSPQVALGNNAMAQSAGNISTPQASGLPNFVTPTMQTPPSVMLSAVDSISKLAGAASQLATAKKTNKEASWIDKEMEATIKNLFADVRYKQAEASYQEFQLSLDKVFAPFERSSNMRKTWAEVKKLGAEYTLACSQNETEKANKLLKDAEKALVDANKQTVDESRMYIIDNLKKTGEEIMSRTNANNASAEASRASAENTRQQTEHQKIVNKYADRLEASIIAGNRGQLISTLRQAFRSGHGLYDGIKDFVGTIRENLGLGTNYGTINTIEDLADALLQDAASFDDDKGKK